MLNSSGLLVGNLVNARLNRRGVAPAHLLIGGLSLVVSGSLALLALTLAGKAELALFLPILALLMGGCSITNVNAVQLAIEPLLHIAGTASAAVVSAQLAFGALAGYVVATAYDGHSALSTVATMGAFAFVAISAFLLRPRRAESTCGGFSPPAGEGEPREAGPDEGGPRQERRCRRLSFRPVARIRPDFVGPPSPAGGRRRGQPPTRPTRRRGAWRRRRPAITAAPAHPSARRDLERGLRRAAGRGDGLAQLARRQVPGWRTISSPAPSTVARARRCATSSGRPAATPASARHSASRNT